MSDPVEVSVPRENNNDEVVTLIKWHLEDGDEVRPDQVIVDVEGSKSVFEVMAPSGGFVRRAAEEGDEIPIGGTLCRLFASVEAAAGWAEDEHANAHADTVTLEPIKDGTLQFVRFSRAARTLIEERGVAPVAFEGSGFVRLSDVLEFLGEGGSRRTPDQAPARSEARPDGARNVLNLPGSRVPLSPSKRTEGRYIRASHRSTLPSSVTVCVPTRGLKAALESDAISSNTTSLIIYESARLLKKYPLFNACYDDGDVYMYSDVNIGFAVDAGSGLKVPVIHQADAKNLEEITEALRDLLVAYMNEELKPADQVDGTFTVTDLSTENVFSFQPLINKGQSAILGIGAEYFFPGSREGLFNLTLQFDHQVAEGRMAAAFLNELAMRLKGYESAFGQRVSDTDSNCSRCYRDYSELRAANHFLVQCVSGDGSTIRVCSGCLQGW